MKNVRAGSQYGEGWGSARALPIALLLCTALLFAGTVCSPPAKARPLRGIRFHHFQHRGKGCYPLGYHHPYCDWHSIPDLINQVFGAHGAYARCIAWRESRYKPWVTNPYSGAAGLWQFLPSWWRGHGWNPYLPVVATVHAYWASSHGTNWRYWGYECG